MRFIADIIGEVTAWKKNNPNSFFHAVELVPRNLHYVISAVTDFGVKKFIVPIAAITKNRVSADQNKIIFRYINARIELREAEDSFIKLFTSELN